MSDAFAKGLNCALGKLVLADVEVFNLVESLEVLEEGGHSGFILNCVALEGERNEVRSGGNHLCELKRGLGVQHLIHNLDFLLL